MALMSRAALMVVGCLWNSYRHLLEEKEQDIYSYLVIRTVILEVNAHALLRKNCPALLQLDGIASFLSEMKNEPSVQSLLVIAIETLCVKISMYRQYT